MIFRACNFLLLISVSLVPLSLISGSFFPDLFASLSALLMLYIIINKNLFSYLTNKYSIFFFAYCTYLIILSLLSENIILSLESTLFYLRFGFFAISVLYLLDTNKNFLLFFSISIFTAFFILILDTLSAITFENSFFGNRYNGKYYTSVFGEEKIMGSYISRLFPLMIFVLYCLKKINFIKKYFNFLNLLIIILCLFLVLLSNERAAIVIILINIFLYSIFRFDKYLNGFIIILMLAILTFITISKEYRDFLLRGIYEPTTSEINSVNLYKNIFRNIDFPSDYYKLYSTGVKIFKDNYIFGIGPKNYRIKCAEKKYWFNENQKDGCSTHPHHLFLQLLIETGIVGFIPILAVFISAIFIFLKNSLSVFMDKTKYNNLSYSVLLISLITNLMPIIPSGNFYGNWLSVIYFLPIGFIIHFKNKQIY